MFAVLFEVHPKSDRWDAYLGHASMLRPELEQVEGFVDKHSLSKPEPRWLDTLVVHLAERKGGSTVAHSKASS